MPARRALGGPLEQAGADEIAFSPDGERLVITGWDGPVLWDIASREPLGPLPDTAVDSVAFSPNGRTLALAGFDGLTLADARTRRRLGRRLTSESVASIAFSPDGGTLASGSEDGKVQLWDVAKRRPVGHPLPGHTYAVTGVAFSPDGDTLASPVSTAASGSGHRRAPLPRPATRRPPLRRHEPRLQSRWPDPGVSRRRGHRAAVGRGRPASASPPLTGHLGSVNDSRSRQAAACWPQPARTGPCGYGATSRSRLHRRAVHPR